MIEVKNLTKKYGNHVAVRDLSFTIESGKIYGLLGPNGAGKSTTMNIITGCLSQTSGEVFIDGMEIFENGEKVKKLVGYLPEQPPLYQDMTPYEYLLFVAKAKKIDKADLDNQVERVIKVTRLEEVSHRMIKNLSKGYKQRVGIAQALLGEPKIIILDEPTVGLDPKQIIEIRDLIKTLGKSHTVILSSHILSEVQAICDVVMIISGGKLVANDTPENLERFFEGSSSIEMTVKATEAEVTEVFKGIEDVSEVKYSPAGEDNLSNLSITIDGAKDYREEIFFKFADIKRPILEMTMKKVSLEDIFLELTDEKKKDSSIKEKLQKASVSDDSKEEK